MHLTSLEADLKVVALSDINVAGKPLRAANLRKAGISGELTEGYGGPENLRHITQFRKTFFTACLPFKIQKYSLSIVSVSFTPLCFTLSGASKINNLAK